MKLWQEMKLTDRFYEFTLYSAIPFLHSLYFYFSATISGNYETNLSFANWFHACNGVRFAFGDMTMTERNYGICFSLFMYFIVR
jgi:hypothetical protein